MNKLTTTQEILEGYRLDPGLGGYYDEYLAFKHAARMASLLERAIEILKDEENDVWHKEVRALFLSDFQKFQDGENV